MMVVGIAMLASAANAMGPAAYIGLYADEACADMSWFGVGAAFDMYCFVNPSDNGVSVLEYKIDIDGGATVYSSFTPNDVILAGIGAPYGGAGVQISCTCQMDWFWTYKINFFVASPVPSYFVVVGSDALYPDILVGGCDPLKTLEDLHPLNKFGLNQEGELLIIANESATWGAIKSLINE